MNATAALALHVCMVNPLVTHEIGGVQRQLHLQSRALVERGITVSVIQRRDREWTADKAARWAHVRFIDVPDGMRRLGLRGHGLLFVLCALFQIARRRRTISIIHAHQVSSPMLVGVLAKWLFGLPVVVKVTAGGQSGEMAELPSLPLARLRRRFFKSVDRILVLTETMRAEVVANVKVRDDQVLIFPNGVVVAPEFPTRVGTRGAPFVLLYAGRISEEKSLETLLEAANLLIRDGLPGVEVHLVGPVFAPRDPMHKLKAVIETLDHRVAVIFHGYQVDVAPFYQRADVFVLPSRSEGMSNALLEAMASGTCCVVSDIPENRALIEHGVTGLLFTQGSAESLARQLAGLYEDQRRREGTQSSQLARAAYERVRGTYAIGAIADRLISMYNDVLRARGRAG
jgi:glycosyltransferase involved in cell wall biosynthesis